MNKIIEFENEEEYIAFDINKTTAVSYCKKLKILAVKVDGDWIQLNKIEEELFKKVKDRFLEAKNGETE